MGEGGFSEVQGYSENSTPFGGGRGSSPHRCRTPSVKPLLELRLEEVA